MNIVLLEGLGVPEDLLEQYAKPLRQQGHSFAAYPRSADTGLLIARAKEADVLMLANMPLGGEVIAACPHLAYIDVAFTGVDHIDLASAKARGVRVSNAAGYSTGAVAELTLALMLALLRNLPQSEARCRSGGTKDGLVGRELAGKTVGIVGVGAIGLRVAELCHAFGCTILGHKRHVRGDEPPYIQLVPLDDLFAQADLVSLHCPLTDETRGLVNAARLAQMKQSAYLLNLARGPVVDTAALVSALEGESIAGAAIDVYETEPPLPETQPLLACKNTILTPHIAFASAESMEQRAAIVFRNLDAFLAGGQENVVC